MQPTIVTTGRLGVLAATVAWAISSPAHADTVYLNTPPAFVPQVQSSVAGAKYRLDDTNWDMALHSGTGSNNPVSLPGDTVGDFVQAGLGNLSTLNNVTYRFTVTHQAGAGGGFTYTMTNLGTNATTTLSWGSMSGATTGTLQRWTGSGLDGIDHAPTDPFNFLVIEARAQRNIDNDLPEPDSSMTFSNLSFSGPLLTTSGNLVAGSTNENTPGSLWTPSGGVSEAGRYWQFIYSDVDLSLYDWEFSAEIAGFANDINSPQESLRFELTAKNVTPVPLPAAAWLLLSGIAGLGAAARRRR